MRYNVLTLSLDIPSSAPVALSYDCPANLKEAVDWNLRVTAKDGQTPNNDGTDALTEQVKKLLNDVEGSDPGLAAEIGKVRQSLDSSSGTNLITKLAEGLRQFIGYDGSSNGAPKITGGGIAPSNIATHRLCDAAIAFTIGVLEGCKRHNEFKKKSNVEHLKKINHVIEILYSAYGRGVAGLKSITPNLSGILHSFKGSVQDVNDLCNKLGEHIYQHLITGLHYSSRNVFATEFAAKLGVYLQAVVNTVHVKVKSNVFAQINSLNEPVRNLVESVKKQSSGKYDPTRAADEEKVSDTLTKIQSDVKKLKDSDPTSHTLVSALIAGTKSFMRELWKGNYVSYYEPPAKWQGSDQEKCAKIFLSCIPLIYHGLTHLSWQCSNKNSWSTLQFNGFGGRGGTLNHFMVGAGYTDYNKLSSSAGGNVMAAVASRLPEFQNIANSAAKSYTEYLKGLHERFNRTLKSAGVATVQSHTMPVLFFAAQAYFHHARLSKSGGSKFPTTIRDILYWMAGLPFSPGYAELEKYVGALVPNGGLYIANSETKIKGDIIKAADMKGYLLTSCLSIPGFLGVIQGSSGSKDDPWLHTLLSNGLHFEYPSGPELFKLLCDYTYALQFQLSFLYNQCRSGYDEGFGWRDCKYGQEANKDTNTQMTSFICHADCKEKHSGSGECNEHIKNDTSKCGKDTTSPLQAFLTDNLKGFCRKHPGTSDHLADHPPGAMCHVPMGFTAADVRGDPSRSDRIYYTLYFFCGSQHDPLRRLGETLTCLTKRTPRNLGDIFGFVWHLNSQLFKSTPDVNNTIKDFFTSLGLSNEFPTLTTDPSSAYNSVYDTVSRLPSSSTSRIQKSIVTIFSGLPFLYNIFMVTPTHSLPVALFNLKGTDHGSSYQGTHNDLFGLYNPQCTGRDCGKYLMPLCFSNGATYAPEYASSYLSWVLYVTDDLESGFEKLLEDFQNIDCRKSGCVKCKDKDHRPGEHGINDACSCPSVVHCGGTLPILYSNGFDFYYAYDLCGENSNGKYKKSCQQFHTQLTKVLQPEAPLDKLITTIDAFLYAIRWEFFSKLSGFWTIYMCLILYTFFFLLDTLHLRSHLKFTLSHTVPPLALLTSGNPLPTTKLAYIGQ
ncbi:variant erythrocyte surface antigen-1 family protein [Babesia caballi]|uniref:Variant erythrocyte surface antigen-1 family protein n=1 Tax=Babesia caballi TaxID=5871 RepID=A0AAV4LR38_BABCB|nr:variant erythrocyte surface antigen-1 family protein [Babesia caballi]